jgi:hypothetical protein
MSAFFRDLLALPPEGLGTLHRFIVSNGALYLVLGFGLLAFPLVLPVELAGAPPDGAGMVQMQGLLLAIIGWFYVMGGRTGTDSFALATVVDRVLVPFVIVPLVVFAGAPWSALAFALLDPALAAIALALWARERR